MFDETYLNLRPTGALVPSRHSSWLNVEKVQRRRTVRSASKSHLVEVLAIAAVFVYLHRRFGWRV